QLKVRTIAPARAASPQCALRMMPPFPCRKILPKGVRGQGAVGSEEEHLSFLTPDPCLLTPATGVYLTAAGQASREARPDIEGACASSYRPVQESRSGSAYRVTRYVAEPTRSSAGQSSAGFAAPSRRAYRTRGPGRSDPRS